MMKKVTLALILLCMMFSMVALAAPDYVVTGDAGNTTGLITITRPDKDKDFSYDKGYYFSGVGKNGISVTLYRYDPNAGAYAKLYKNGAPVTLYVGASGLFWTTINLNFGDNFFIARAENSDGTYQVCPFLLTYQSSSLKGIKVNFSDLPFVNNWK